MTRYEILKDKPKRFLSLTGNHTLEEFSALLPSFSKRFLAFVGTQTLDGKRLPNFYSFNFSLFTDLTQRNPM